MKKRFFCLSVALILTTALACQDMDLSEFDSDIEVAEEETVSNGTDEKINKNFKLSDYDDSDDFDDYEDIPKKTTKSRFTRSSRRSSKVVNMNQKPGMEVVVMKPTYYENSKDVIDMLLQGSAVILNLEGMKLDLAQRIVDVVSGGCYSIQGSLQKSSGYIYLITPKSVHITGDYLELLNSDNASSGANNYRDRY